MRNFVFLSGPTASGKTKLSIHLAQKFNALIFNCDSIQVYQELNIGAAKPSLEERSQSPHYLFDLMSAPEVMTAGKYRKAFVEEMNQHPEDQLILVVGGTGFYYQALEKGLFEISETSQEIKDSIMDELKIQNGNTDLFWQEILVRDPDHAKKIHPHDEYRILRAMEILRQNPTTNITELYQDKKQSENQLGRILKIHLSVPKDLLENRIRNRVSEMIKWGLIEETQSLLDKGLKGWAPLSSVGYHETCQYLSGIEKRDGLEEKILIATRQLAKKQRTWFKKQPDLITLDATSVSSLKTEVEAQLASFLTSM